MSKLKTTSTSFLSYFAMAAVITPLGVVNEPIAEFFGVSLTDATAIFSFLTGGLLIGSLVAIGLFDIMSLKRVVLSQSLVFIMMIVILHFSGSFMILSICFLVIGINAGILLSAAAVVISKIYTENMRASMLLLTDSFYSIGGFVSATMAGWVVSEHLYKWSYAYLPVFVVLTLIVSFTITAKFPSRDVAKEDAKTVVRQKWPLTAILCGAGLFIYLVGFITIISWVPAYARSLQADENMASSMISNFFIGQFISQIIMFFLVHVVKAERLILSIIIILVVISCFIWNTTEPNFLRWTMIALGLMGGGLLKTSLSYGTLLIKRFDSRLIAFLVFCTGLGSAISPILSAKIVEISSITTVLQFASGLYLVMFVLFALVVYLKSTTRFNMLKTNPTDR